MDSVQTAVDKLDGTKFQIFSGLLKASRSADGRLRLHGIASSTTRDLHGDTMEASALEDMERAANNNLTIFLNHSYEVPEDVAGSVERAKMKVRGVDAGGNPNYDLDMDIIVNDANERAVKAFEAIERGTKLGLSIGALIPDGGATKDATTKAWLIQHVELLETSLVGIPANPRSWVEYAVKSLNGGGIAAPIVVGEDGPELVLAAPEPDVTDAYQSGCPDCEDGDPCSKHKDVTPDVTDATVTIEIDTGDGSSASDPEPDASASQEALESNPGTGEEIASGDDAIDPSSLTLTVAVNKAVELMGQLIEAKTSIKELTVERDAALRDRDAAKEEATRVLTETQRVLESLADTPLMRRAVLVDAQASLSEQFSGIYGESLLKHLEK